MTGMDKLQKYAGEYGIALSDKMLDSFSDYGDLLLQWNKKMNLTAITEPKDIIIKHFLDSIIPLKYIKGEKISLIDIGSGAGFPGIPVKIVMRDISLTLLDSSEKRISFLEAVTEKLGLKAICIKARAEEFAIKQQAREKYDYSVARAVSALPVLCEYCIPFIKTGGSFIALKGSEIDKDLELSKKAIDVLGGEHKKTIKFKLPGGASRSLVIIKKISQTPINYPRKTAKILKMPLQ